jgi:hypothetical protein
VTAIDLLILKCLFESLLLLRETGDMVVDSDEPTNKKIYM